MPSVVTLADRPEFAEAVRTMPTGVPPFMLNDPISWNFASLGTLFPAYQLALLDDKETVIGAGIQRRSRGTARWPTCRIKGGTTSWDVRSARNSLTVRRWQLLLSRSLYSLSFGSQRIGRRTSHDATTKIQPPRNMNVPTVVAARMPTQLGTPLFRTHPLVQRVDM
jgi:hypothetical protein